MQLGHSQRPSLTAPLLGTQDLVRYPLGGLAASEASKLVLDKKPLAPRPAPWSSLVPSGVQEAPPWTSRGHPRNVT